MHIHEQANLSILREVAQAGKLAGLTIINNLALANEMVEFVPLVVFRWVQTDHDNPQQGFIEYGADPRVIYQFGNEANIPDDSDHWIQVMRDCGRYGTKGRKVAIFQDSVGATEDQAWIERRPALEYAKAYGHYAALHCYGDVTKGDTNYCPMIDPLHPDAFRWFTGRVFHLYSLMPPEAQPDFIATEAGAGGFQTNATLAQWLADVQRFNTFCQDYPWFKAFNLWTMGGGGAYGFERDKIDGYVHLLM